MRSVFIASALKSALYREPARHVYRLLKYHVLAVFRYSARDAHALIEYYYWLEDHQSRKLVVLDQAPVELRAKGLGRAAQRQGLSSKICKDGHGTGYPGRERRAPREF